MKIAILSTPWVSVPPQGYGGSELVVANLIEELVKKGHQVMLFATGDSQTSARLEFEYDKALGNNWSIKQNPYYSFNHIHKFFSLVKNEDFDILHNHNQYFPMFFFDLQDKPFVHTLHGAFYSQLKSNVGYQYGKREILLRFSHHPFISISDNQRQGLPQLNYIKTIYNGIRPQDFHISAKKENYLAWLGRVTPSKGLDVAIKVAQATGILLKIAGFIDDADRQYFEKEIKPLINENKNLVEFKNELKTVKEKAEFLAGALATLFPIRWSEPFGLVMVESLASGTPVIAFNKGSVPEIIEDGKTGFIVNNEEEMINAIKKITSISPSYCREQAFSRFRVEKMVDDYLIAYQTVIDRFKKINQ